jgi:hypothetical protein
MRKDFKPKKPTFTASGIGIFTLKTVSDTSHLDIMKKQTENSDRTLKLFGTILILVECLSILPLLMIALYNHPSGDDFCYGTLTFHAWTDTGSFWETLKAAFVTMKETYLAWQGTFSGIFLLSLQPGIFGEEWYPISTALALGSYLIGVLLLGRVILVDYLGVQKKRCFLICFTLFTCSLHLVPFPRESYYWFVGSGLYTFFYALELVLLAMVLKIPKTNTLSGSVLLTLSSILIAFIVGGGNFITALQAFILLFLFSAYLILVKSKNIVPVGLIFVSLLTSLTISILAPGNAIRQALIPNHPSAIMSILLSFPWAGYHFLKWSSLYLVGIFLLMLPFIVRIVRETSFAFRQPWLVLVISFLIFTASFTAPLYGMGKCDERVLDIIYYSFFALMALNGIYLIGWLIKQKASFLTGKRLNGLLKNPSYFILAGTVVLLSAFALKPNIACKLALQSLTSGETKQYDVEATARLKSYLDKNQKKCVVDAFTVQPTLLFLNDMDANPTDWKNKGVASFYRKDSVVLRKRKID